MDSTVIGDTFIRCDPIWYRSDSSWHHPHAFYLRRGIGQTSCSFENISC